MAAVRVFAVRVARTVGWAIDTLILQVLLARPLHPPASRGGPLGPLPHEPGSYDAANYPVERRQRAEEHAQLARRQRSLREIWREPINRAPRDDGQLP